MISDAPVTSRGENLRRSLSPERVDMFICQMGEIRHERDLPLAPLTTYQVGGAARVAVFPRSPDEVAHVVRVAREGGLPMVVLGRGSNVLVSDHGIDAIVVVLRDLAQIADEGSTLVVGAGADCSVVAARALEAGLVGVEFMNGLPGSVGGAAFMNARAFGQEMSHVWRAARLVTPEGSIVSRRYELDDFSYKRSPLQQSGELAVELELDLTPGDRDEIRRQMERNAATRSRNGETAYPSCGCVFKNDVRFGSSSGQLIDRCGLKGFRIGQAQVSPLHANFVVNLGGASARDLRAVMEHVREIVARETGHTMEFEVRFLGAFESPT